MSEFLDAHVVWADSLHDSVRECIICDQMTCIDPVHPERYKVRSNTIAKKWDAQNPVI